MKRTLPTWFTPASTPPRPEPVAGLAVTRGRDGA